MKAKFLFSLLLVLFALAAKADGLQVVTAPVDGCFTIVGTKATDKCIILYDINDAEVVHTVLDCLLSDMNAVTTRSFAKYRTEPSSHKNPIIIGTIGQSSHRILSVNGLP